MPKSKQQPLLLYSDESFEIIEKEEVLSAEIGLGPAINDFVIQFPIALDRFLLSDWRAKHCREVINQLKAIVSPDNLKQLLSKDTDASAENWLKLHEAIRHQLNTTSFPLFGRLFNVGTALKHTVETFLCDPNYCLSRCNGLRQPPHRSAFAIPSLAVAHEKEMASLTHTHNQQQAVLGKKTSS